MKRMTKQLAIILAIVLMIGLIAGCGEDEEQGKKQIETDKTTTVPVTEIITTPPKETDAPFAVYEAGQHKVGDDMPAGKYMLLTNKGQSAYFSVTDSQGNILFNDNFQNLAYVELVEGDYIALERCAALDRTERQPKIGDLHEINNGTYLVGHDIPAGEYKLKGTRSEGRGYYSVITWRHDIVKNDFFQGTAYVTVGHNDLLKLSDALIIKAPTD